MFQQSLGFAKWPKNLRDISTTTLNLKRHGWLAIICLRGVYQVVNKKRTERNSCQTSVNQSGSDNGLDLVTTCPQTSLTADSNQCLALRPLANQSQTTLGLVSTRSQTVLGPVPGQSRHGLNPPAEPSCTSPGAFLAWPQPVPRPIPDSFQTTLGLV